MTNKTKYLLGASALVVVGLGSLILFNRKWFKSWKPSDKGEGINEDNVGGAAQEEENTTGETAIIIGNAIKPLGVYVNVRSAPYVDNDTGIFDMTDNIITIINKPAIVGVVDDIIPPADNLYNANAEHTWYKVELEESEEYMVSLFSYSRVGYVRADVVEKV